MLPTHDEEGADFHTGNLIKKSAGEGREGVL
jgi:hypothetical protein